MKDIYRTISYTFEFHLTTAATAGFYLPHAINDFDQIVGDFTQRGPSSPFLYDDGVLHEVVRLFVTPFRFI